MAASARPPLLDPDDWFAPAAWEDVPTREQPLRRNERRPSTDSGRLLHRLLAQPHASGRLRYGRVSVAATTAVIICTLIALAASGAFTGNKPTAQPRPVATISPRPSTPKPAQARIAAPTQPLNPGAHGTQVTRLQRGLHRLGYLTGASDGAYGPKTTRALAAFQQHSGLTPDGILGPQTLLALRQALTQRD